eukprot:CAMPEP_0184659640 /NCGR_PEP_ID=MMETSP0308-20130426/30428_1 /TAXON_ID=38269 /ORGANISM="Gloeochaete witrockiana, Strain SAG 46.84" /LENGTH=53 /DNA_ID=CAMNT_0027099605 /DNA_START=308 /DNA_END=469 /DNA_ORIENTATION=-
MTLVDDDDAECFLYRTMISVTANTMSATPTTPPTAAPMINPSGALSEELVVLS